MFKNTILLVVLSLISSLTFASNGAVNSLKEGDGYYADGEVQKAQTSYEKAVEQYPDSADAWFKLARTQMVNNYHSASIKSYQKSISLDQNNALAFAGMAIAYMHIGKYNHARASFTEAARIDPSKKTEVDKVLKEIDSKLQAVDESTAKATRSGH